MESILAKLRKLCHRQNITPKLDGKAAGAVQAAMPLGEAPTFNFQKLPCELRLEILRMAIGDSPPYINQYGRLHHKLLSESLLAIRGEVLDVIFHTVPIEVSKLYVDFWHPSLKPDFVKMHDAVHGRHQRHRVQLRPSVERSRSRFLELVERRDQKGPDHCGHGRLLFEIHKLQLNLAFSAKELRALAREFYLGSDGIFIDGNTLSDKSEQISLARERNLEAMR